MRTSIAAGAAVAIVGIAGSAAFARVDLPRALVAWVAAFAFGLGIALGALLLVMIMHLTKARWFVVLRPLALAVASTLPLFILLFVPIALGMKVIFPWAHHVAGLDEELARALEHQRTWQAPAFFLVRAGACLGAWSTFAFLLARAASAYGTRPAAVLEARQRAVSALGLPIVAFTMTWAAVDWFMSLNVGWFSDIFGVYFFAAGFAGACALLALLAWAARRARILPREVGPDHFHAVGRLMLLGTIFWAYVAFCQLLLMWIADIPREITFYVARIQGPWKAVDYVLVFGRFVLPLLLLLRRDLKRRPHALAVVAVWMILMHAVDAEWLMLPVLGPHVSPLDVMPFLAVGGSAFAFGAWRYFARDTVPTRDPALADSLRYHSP
jgi:hypothetical protein